MADPLDILFANGMVQAVQVYIWDGSEPILWDGSVTASITVGGVEGTKSNNAVVPGATNLGVLPAIATAAAPSYTEGRQVGLSTDLAGSLRVAATISTAGLATEAKQDVGNTSLASIDGKITAVNTGAVVVSSSALPTGASTLAEQQTQTTALQIIDDWDETDRAKVNPIVGQAGVQGASGTVSATTQRVVLATDVGLPAGTANIGDVDVLTVPRSMSGPGQPGTAVDSYTHAAFNLAAGNDQVLVASAANKQIWVYGIGFVLNVAGTVSFQDEDNTAITGIMPFAANSGLAIAPSGNFCMPIWKLATDKDLEVDVVTAEMDGWVDYAILSV